MKVLWLIYGVFVLNICGLRGVLLSLVNLLVVGAHELLPVDIFVKQIGTGAVGIEPFTSKPHQYLPPVVNVGGQYLALRSDTAQFAVYERHHLAFVHRRRRLRVKLYHIKIGAGAELIDQLRPLRRYLRRLSERHLLFAARALMVDDKENLIGVYMVQIVIFIE